MFTFYIDTSEGKETLHEKQALWVWNSIMNMASEIKKQCLQQSAVSQYSSCTQLAMHHIVNDFSKLTYKKPRADLQIWIGWLLVSCDLGQCGSHLLCLNLTEWNFLLSGRDIEKQVAHKVF